VRYGVGSATSESIVMRALSGSIRVIRTEHHWDPFRRALD
jgi:hypothetical protein